MKESLKRCIKLSLKPLVGKRITKVDVSNDDFPQITLDDGTVLEISSDEECNKGGFIFKCFHNVNSLTSH